MASTYRVLGQLNPSANTQSTLYTVPATANAVCSTLSICNLGQSTSYRVAVQPGNATLANTHYVVYDSAVAASDTVFLTLGISLAETDVISVRASTGNVTFGLFGSEIRP